MFSRKQKEFMRYRRLTLLFLLSFVSMFLVALPFSSRHIAISQTANKNVNSNRAARVNSDEGSASVTDIIKVDVDLVKVDALVLEKKTARAVGGLQREDFLIYEDGARQQITHFSKDTLPLSVLVVIDRGGCLDPFREELHPRST